MNIRFVIVFIALLIMQSCKKELKSTTGNTCNPPTVADVDGNVYHTLKIGNQCWLQENLTASHYQDGSLINEEENDSAWAEIYSADTSEGAWCYTWNGNAANNAIYGKLYNWYAVNDPRQLCPAGWHVATDSDFQILNDYLGGRSVAGGHMKADSLWLVPLVGGDNSSGFAALPGGSRATLGQLSNEGFQAYFWTSTQYDSIQAWGRNLGNNYTSLDRGYSFKAEGFSVRCVSN